MAHRAAKLRKLDDFRRRNPHVTASALESIIRDINQHGSPELFTRQQMNEAKELLTSTETNYGPLLQDLQVVHENGQPIKVEACHPLAFQCYCFQACDAWYALLLKRLQLKPPTENEPWNLILYTDEVTPGNALAVQTSRKVYAIYYSFKELGAAALACEDAWFCLTVVRSSLVHKLQSGGLPQIIAQLLLWFFPADGTNLMTTGLHLQREGGPSFRLFAKLATVVQDGLAHKELWSCRDGTRMCMSCLTVSDDSELANFDPAIKTCGKVLTEAAVEFTTDESVKSSARRL
eukprot:8114341-Karenia_brevis.AAC.1